MLLHKLMRYFVQLDVNFRLLGISSNILETVPVSQDSKECAKCKLGEFVHNNTKPLFRIVWHFWPNTKYSGEISLISSVDIHRESRLTQCVRTLMFFKCQTHWDFTLCQNSTVASTFNLRQYLQSLEISKQISCVLRGINLAIPRKLIKISDCRVSSFLKTVPGCWVPRHSVFVFTTFLTSSVIYYWTDARQHGIYLLNSELGHIKRVPRARGQTFQPLLRRNREALLAQKALRRAPTARASRGVWGHAPPGNFANLVSLKWHFLHFDIIFVVFFKVLDSEKMD